MKVGVAEAKRRISQLLDQVANGGIVLITRRGAPVAVLRRADMQDVVLAAAFRPVYTVAAMNEAARAREGTADVAKPAEAPKPPAIAQIPASAPGLTLSQIMAASR